MFEATEMGLPLKVRLAGSNSCAVSAPSLT